MGREAAHRIDRDGWAPELFSLLLGASGGPKWFVLAQLDRFLFGDYLQRSTESLSALGSSIGSWRHTCLAMPDPVAAIDAMEDGYLHQRYACKPTAIEVSEVSRAILRKVVGDIGGEHLVNHPRIRTHIITARGRGPSASASPPVLGVGMGAAALSNTVSRRWLGLHFQRVVFHSGQAPEPGLSLADFDTRYCPLRAETLVSTLHASGAIPFVLAGERDIPGAPTGHYWDGGIIDYHFDLRQYAGEGLMLYPHFSPRVIPGWFDKFLPHRRGRVDSTARLVLLCPTADFTADLPFGKIPDRNDFTRLGEEERIRYWETCVARCQALAEEFASLVEGGDPLRGVTVFD